MARFKQSFLFGMLVRRAKKKKGWLSDDEFTRLGRKEFQLWQASRAIIGAILVILMFVFFSHFPR